MIISLLQSISFDECAAAVTISNQRPEAEIVPDSLNAEALAVVNFSAKGSMDPDSEAVAYDWSLNALPFGSNPAHDIFWRLTRL